MNKVLKTLKYMRDNWSKDQWIKNVLAKNKQGSTTHPNSKNAVSHCLLGKLYSVETNQYSRDHIIDVFNKVIRKHMKHATCIASFNDFPETTWADIQNVIKEAITYIKTEYKES